MSVIKILWQRVDSYVHAPLLAVIHFWLETVTVMYMFMNVTFIVSLSTKFNHEMWIWVIRIPNRLSFIRCMHSNFRPTVEYLCIILLFFHHQFGCSLLNFEIWSMKVSVKWNISLVTAVIINLLVLLFSRMIDDVDPILYTVLLDCVSIKLHIW